MKTGANPLRGYRRRAAGAPVRCPVFYPSYIVLFLPFAGVLWPGGCAREQHPLHMAGHEEGRPATSPVAAG
jgi:hypothetical protein